MARHSMASWGINEVKVNKIFSPYTDLFIFLRIMLVSIIKEETLCERYATTESLSYQK